MNPQYRRRRLTAGAGIAIALGVAAAVVSGNNSNIGLTPRPPTVAGPVQTTPEVDPRPPLVGDLVMTTMRGTTASPNLVRRARLGRIAGVLLGTPSCKRKT